MPRSPDVLDDLSASLAHHLSTLVADLGLDRKLHVTAAESEPGATTATVSIDGRPVVHCRWDTANIRRAPGHLEYYTMSRVLRRLPLLAGQDIAGTSAYLLALGCRLPDGVARLGLDVEAAEQLAEVQIHDEIVLEVAAVTMRRLEPEHARALAEFREREFQRRGVLYPDVRVVLTDDDPGSVRLHLNDVTLPVRQLGAGAGWSDVVQYMDDELSSRRHWFVRMRDVQRVLEQDLSYVVPGLVNVCLDNYSLPQLTACLRELVRSGRRIRNLPRILWLLVEAGGSPAGSDVLRMSESPLLPKARRRPTAEGDPMVQAIRVRKFATEEAWRLGIYRPPEHAVRLPQHIEEDLFADGQPLASAEWAAVRALADWPQADRVITRTVDAVGRVRDALQAGDNVPRVIASHELPPDADLDALHVVGDPARASAEPSR